MAPVTKPTFLRERVLLASGVTVIAGLDEAGSGCWAGPVFAAAVVLPASTRVALIRDSKTLSAAQRERVAVQIREAATAWAVGEASAEEIDRMNVRRAGALAMRRAVEALSVAPQHLLIDAFRLPELAHIPQTPIIRGDSKVKSIAAASILAKVARDARLRELHARHPAYGFDVHKGYGTKRHQAALAAFGPCEEHRKSYAPVRALLAAGSRRPAPHEAAK